MEKDLIIKNIHFQDSDIYDMTNHQDMMNMALNSVKNKEQFEIKADVLSGGKGVLGGVPIEVVGNINLDDLTGDVAFEEGFICLYIETKTVKPEDNPKAKPKAQFQFLETVPENEINTLKEYIQNGGTVANFRETNKVWVPLYKYNKSTRDYTNLRNSDFFFDIKIETNGGTLNLEINGEKSNVLNVDLTGITQRVLFLEELKLTDSDFTGSKEEIVQKIYDAQPSGSIVETFVDTGSSLLALTPFGKEGNLTIKKDNIKTSVLTLNFVTLEKQKSYDAMFDNGSLTGEKFSGFKGELEPHLVYDSGSFMHEGMKIEGLPPLKSEESYVLSFSDWNDDVNAKNNFDIHMVELKDVGSSFGTVSAIMAVNTKDKFCIKTFDLNSGDTYTLNGKTPTTAPNTRDVVLGRIYYFTRDADFKGIDETVKKTTVINPDKTTQDVSANWSLK